MARQQLRKHTATHSNAEVINLGLSLREYQLTNDCSQLGKVTEVAHTHPWPRTVIKDVASFRLCVARVKVLDEAMSKTCTAWGQDTLAYSHSFLCRKFLGELCSTPVSDRNVSWAGSEAFSEAAKVHHEQYGIASHPYT